jgi:hypothetical protein
MKRIIFLMIIISLMLPVLAIDSIKQERLDFGYVLYVKSISTDPANLIPGQVGLLKISLENKAGFPLYDIRTQLTLPSQVSFYEDISKRKISIMDAGEIKELSYKIIPLPTSLEGVYQASYNLNYLNHVATEREENDSFSLIIRSHPEIMIEFEKSDIYKGNLIGDIGINLINDELSNIKFLNVELQENQDYVILSSNRKYVGDLDSNDFQTVDFKLKVNENINQINLPIKVYYKDTFNKDYEQNLNLEFNIKDSKEIQNKKNNYWIYLLIIVVVIILVYILIQKRKRRHERDSKTSKIISQNRHKDL